MLKEGVGWGDGYFSTTFVFWISKLNYLHVSLKSKTK